MEIKDEKMAGIVGCIFNNPKKYYLSEIPTQNSLLSFPSTFPIPITSSCQNRKQKPTKQMNE